MLRKQPKTARSEPDPTRGTTLMNTMRLQHNRVEESKKSEGRRVWGWVLRMQGTETHARVLSIGCWCVPRCVRRACNSCD